LFKVKGVKIIFAPFQPESVPLMANTLDAIDKGGKQYGEDYVTLPVIPGQPPAAFAKIADNFRGSYPADYQGTPIDNLHAMDGINTLGDFDVIIWIEPAKFQPLVPQIIYPRFSPPKYNVTYFCVAISEGYMFVAPYVGKGNVYLSGLWGVRPAAEYQKLTNAKYGTGFTGAVAQMDALSMYHILVIVLIVLGNIGLIAEKTKKQEGNK
jgi:hypothetical protein